MSLVVVTGASRGIGLSLCRALAARGDQVIAAVRKSSPELRELGVEVVEGIDVADSGTLGPLKEALGRRNVDVLINNAGIMARTALPDLDEAAIRRQFEVNALGPVRVTVALLERFAPSAKLALVTSRMGSIADNTSGGSYGYRMSKAALNAAGKSLAHDLASRGIAVVILHPGWVQTDMTGGTGHVGPDESARMLIERIDELTLERTGRFVHANGQELPW